MDDTLTTIATATLARVEAGRRRKAQCGLADDTLRVHITKASPDPAVFAVIVTGKGNYEVAISGRHDSAFPSVFCSCADFAHRYAREGVICKHVAGLAYFILGTTTPEAPPAPFACGDVVQLRGIPSPGKVVCVSQDTISVQWLPLQCQLPEGAEHRHVYTGLTRCCTLTVSTRAYRSVELEYATQPLPTVPRQRPGLQLGKRRRAA